MTWEARVEADSLNVANGARLTTFVLRYPRFPVHEQLLTHRMLSRNARSYRAVSNAKLVDGHIYVPDDWRVDRPRMRQEDRLEANDDAENLWRDAEANATFYAVKLAELGVHRQTTNRVVQPYRFITTVASATDWWWWFRLRLKHDVDPPTAKLAWLMLDAYLASKPAELHPGEWHLPFVRPEDRRAAAVEVAAEEEPQTLWERRSGKLRVDALLCRLSTARAARVSTLTFEGKVDPDADQRLHDTLVREGHWSPFEHPAQAQHDPRYQANFKGWRQYRSFYPDAYDDRPISGSELARLRTERAAFPAGPA